MSEQPVLPDRPVLLAPPPALLPEDLLDELVLAGAQPVGRPDRAVPGGQLPGVQEGPGVLEDAGDLIADLDQALAQI